ncbi:hypothetical protein BJ508DRAFT_303102 [Ascobolus immersus RN42]|uniref:Uncharacterized protein n=1 Tax=Ascobolus immersus RN42 TaxID=1160509 RepID=A0A3N4IK47_ASCIM|nr:hypothetical protein BJ508DRAFT_303102 [Ascobolus immersus RN42]
MEESRSFRLTPLHLRKLQKYLCEESAQGRNNFKGNTYAGQGEDGLGKLNTKKTSPKCASEQPIRPQNVQTRHALQLTLRKTISYLSVRLYSKKETAKSTAVTSSTKGYRFGEIARQGRWKSLLFARPMGHQFRSRPPKRPEIKYASVFEP